MPAPDKPTIPYFAQPMDWFPTKTDNSTRRLNTEVLEGCDVKPTLITVLPYLEKSLPEELYRFWYGEKVRIALNRSTPRFIAACIEHFFGNCYKASYEARFQLLSQIRDYLFRDEGVKPRIIRAGKKRLTNAGKTVD